MRIPQLWISAALCSIILILIGCESTQSTGGLARAKTDFDAHRYNEARKGAVAALQTSIGADRQDAAYLAGLSAYKLDNMNEAETYFAIAIKSPDRQTSGNAKAMMGLIRLNQGRNREAAQLFKETASTLKGSDAKQAAQHASIAYEAAGDYDAADRWMRLASSSEINASSSVSRMVISNEFALQVGAFRDKSRAEQAAKDAADQGKSHSMGSARVYSQRNERGQNLYVVQIGSFATRRQATQARTQMGNLEYIVTSVNTEQMPESSQNFR